jgi:ribonuclease BN (tRNA processing enzyme)
MDVTPTRVRFLGSGDAFGSGGRFQACIHVRSQDSTVLLDCGASSLIAMRRFGVEPNDIDAILVSHLHGDHFGGIPFFILDGQFLSRRKRPLLIAGPPGIEERVRQAQEALFDGSSQTHQEYEIRFLEWRDRQRQTIADISVTPFEVVHASGAPPFAFRLEVDGKTITYSGDTEWTDTLVEAAQGVDLFICEANFYDKSIKFHLNYETLMAHRDELRCKRMVLTHMNAEMLARLDSLEVETAEDGESIVL